MSWADDDNYAADYGPAARRNQSHLAEREVLRRDLDAARAEGYAAGRADERAGVAAACRAVTNAATLLAYLKRAAGLDARYRRACEITQAELEAAEKVLYAVRGEGGAT